MLDQLYQQLVRRAAASGVDRGCDLKGGARIAVRVRGGETIVTFSRVHKRLGDGELITFRRICAVPEGAARIPTEGQKTRTDDQERTWFYVAYRWPSVPTAEPVTEDSYALARPRPAAPDPHARRRTCD